MSLHDDADWGCRACRCKSLLRVAIAKRAAGGERRLELAVLKREPLSADTPTTHARLSSEDATGRLLVIGVLRPSSGLAVQVALDA